MDRSTVTSQDQTTLRYKVETLARHIIRAIAISSTSGSQTVVQEQEVSSPLCIDCTAYLAKRACKEQNHHDPWRMAVSPEERCSATRSSFSYRRFGRSRPRIVMCGGFSQDRPSLKITSEVCSRTDLSGISAIYCTIASDLHFIA